MSTCVTNSLVLFEESLINSIKHIVAVASGKGGVGKSTVAINLALALKEQGHESALLDADIYGPSQQRMLGVAEGVRPDSNEGKYLLPIVAHGIKAMSIGFLSEAKTPMVWRGPMAGSALVQMLEQTLWGDVEYLIVDMPPGTGDIQLTLSQKVSLSGAVIVTTPQDIALLDAQKGLEMFRKVDVPILGVVENMAVHICAKCGYEEHIFGFRESTNPLLNNDTPILAKLPLDICIRENGDSGEPTVIAQPKSEITKRFKTAAMMIVDALESNSDSEDFPEITVSDD